MVEIRYRDGLYTYKTKEAAITKGMIATYTDNYEVGICNNKTRPIGVFTSPIPWDSPHQPAFSLAVGVATGLGEFKVDCFEEGTYKINDVVFCSPMGLITNNRKIGGPFSVGIVNYVQDDFIGFLTNYYPLPLK